VERFEADVVLRDGSLARVRPVHPEDTHRLVEFVEALSAETLSQRFFSAAVDKEAEALRMTPGPDRFGLLAWREGKVVGQASYFTTAPGHAEPAVTVADAYQGKGLGTILLGQLAEAASNSGIPLFEAVARPGNHRIIKVLRQLGFPMTLKSEPGMIRVIFPTSLLPEALEQFERRDAIAATAAAASFLRPKSIAVIGASRQKGSIGGELFRNIIEGGFNGPAYPVNAKADVVQSVAAYRSVLDIPGPVDMALIAVPASAVVAVARECAQKRVHSLVVISAGFAELGQGGVHRQEELVQVCREAGMRLVGPNCMGIINNDAEVQLNAQFSPFKPEPGRLGFLSQSGALGIAVIDHANRLGLGMSSFVSVGNKADISGNDLIQYWEDDGKTDVILLYLESFGNPRKFVRIAKRVAKKKPIIAVKSGRSVAGFRATQSHTGALVATSDVSVDALFRQSGVIRTDSLEEMFDAAALLETQPLPRGDRVGIITNAGGAGILAADACEDLGLMVPELSSATQVALRGFLHPDAGVRNPVDMVASATAEDYARSIQTVAGDPGVDALIVIFIPPIAVRPQDVANEILKVASILRRRLTILCTFMACRGIPSLLSDGEVRVPSYPFPEAAARALAQAVHYSQWLMAPEGRQPRFSDLKKEEAISLVATALGRGAGWLPPEETEILLTCYGIPLVETLSAATPAEAARAATTFPGAIALKAIAPGLFHKTEMGGVKLGLRGEDEVRSAAELMLERLGSTSLKVSGFLVQPMVHGGVEMLVGVTNDPIFGPVLVCGAGGVLVELLKDLSVRLTPITDRDATDMVASLKTFPLLMGYRGGARQDIAKLEEIVLRVGALVEDLPEVAELDLNPVMVLPEGRGVRVVDARIRLAVARPALPLGAKRR